MSRALLILTAIIGVTCSATAQTVDTLTVQETVEQALLQNLELRQAEYQTATREAALGEERLSLLPNLSLSTSSSRRYGLSFDETAGRLTQTATNYISAGVNAGFTLFDGFRRASSLKEAGSRVDAAQASEEWTRQTIIHETLRQFLQVVTAREIVAIRQADVEAQRELLTEVREYIAVGRTAEADLYKQQEALAAGESQLLQAGHELRLARLQLAQTLGRSSSDGLHFEAPAVDSTDPKSAPRDADVLARRALQQRADVESQRLSVETAEHGRRAAKSIFWPSISISGGYGSSYSSAAGGFGFEQQLDRNRGGSIGLSLSFPITGGSPAGSRSAAQRSPGGLLGCRPARPSSRPSGR